MNLVEFNFKPKVADPNKAEKLIKVASQIDRWLMDGGLEWQKGGLQPPQCVQDATRAYLESEDLPGTWLRERYKVERDGMEKTTSLYEDYVEFCNEGKVRPMSKIALGKELDKRGFKDGLVFGAGRVRYGLRRLSEWESNENTKEAPIPEQKPESREAPGQAMPDDEFDFGSLVSNAEKNAGYERPEWEEALLAFLDGKTLGNSTR